MLPTRCQRFWDHHTGPNLAHSWEHNGGRPGLSAVTSIMSFSIACIPIWFVKHMSNLNACAWHRLLHTSEAFFSTRQVAFSDYLFPSLVAGMILTVSGRFLWFVCFSFWNCTNIKQYCFRFYGSPWLRLHSGKCCFYHDVIYAFQLDYNYDYILVAPIPCEMSRDWKHVTFIGFVDIFVNIYILRSLSNNVTKSWIDICRH